MKDLLSSIGTSNFIAYEKVAQAVRQFESLLINVVESEQ